MRNFIVYAPPLDPKSAGNFMLHFLNNSLNDIAEVSRIAEFGSSISEEEKRESIIIYPEIIHNNPLGAEHVARYLLNKDGLLWGQKIERGERDFIFTYSKQYDKDVPVAFFPLVDLEKLQFSDDPATRELNLIYFGKGPALKMEFDGHTPYLLITRKWPAEKDLLISFLQACRHFHSSDCMSSILIEALLCGAAPVIHYWEPGFDKNELVFHELPEVFEMQIDQDFSPRNTAAKSEALRNKVIHFQSTWKDTLTELASMMHRRFS